MEGTMQISTTNLEAVPAITDIYAVETANLLAGDTLKIESEGKDWLIYELPKDAKVRAIVSIKYET